MKTHLIRRKLDPHNQDPQPGVITIFTLAQIDHVVLRVSNLDAMMEFYIDVLNCSVEKIQEDLGLYQLRAGSSLIDLVTVTGKLGQAGGPAPGNQGNNLDHFCLQIEPFDGDALLDYLREHGLEPGPVESRYGARGQGPSVYLQDPEGNTVELKGPPSKLR